MKHITVALFFGLLLLSFNACKKQEITDAIKETGIAGDYKFAYFYELTMPPGHHKDSIEILNDGMLFNISILDEGLVVCYDGSDHTNKLAEWKIVNVDPDENNSNHCIFTIILIWPEKEKIEREYSFSLGTPTLLSGFPAATHTLRANIDPNALFLNLKHSPYGYYSLYLFRKTN